MSTGVMQTWANAVSDLAASVGRFEESVSRKQLALMTVRQADMEKALGVAAAAASAVAASGSTPSPTVQSQWVAVLVQMDAVIRRARDVRVLAEAAGESAVLDQGFRIPGTAIIVPWVAVVGVVAVAGVAWYFTRKRGR